MSKQQHGPILPVCAVVLCVQTTAWLPAFENFVPLLMNIALTNKNIQFSLMNIALTNEYIQFSSQHPCSLSPNSSPASPPPPPPPPPPPSLQWKQAPCLFTVHKSHISSLYTSPTSLHCTQVPHLFTVHKSHISSLYTSRPTQPINMDMAHKLHTY